MGKDRSRTGLVPAYTEAGKIVAVDSVAWTCTVVSETTQRTFYQCLVGTPYTHYKGGEGIQIMPEVGAAVWVTEPSEGDARPFITAFRPQHDNNGSHRSGRAMHNPGDFSFVTRDGNGIKIRRGGVTEVGSNPICRRFYLPIGNLIHDIGENYLLDTFGGELKWSVFRAEEDPDGHKATLLALQFKEFADNIGAVGKLELGGGIETTVNGISSPVAVFQVYEDGNTADPVAALKAGYDKEGDIGLETANLTVKLKTGKSVTIYETSGKEEGVILGKTFLTAFNTFLTGLQTMLSAIGITVPGHADLIANITTSLAAATTGGAPYLSTRLKSE